MDLFHYSEGKQDISLNEQYPVNTKICTIVCTLSFMLKVCFKIKYIGKLKAQIKL